VPDVLNENKIPIQIPMPSMSAFHLTGIAGSLRERSFNRALLEAAQILAPQEIAIDILDIGSLPLFNEDLETNFPEVVQRMKEKIEASDGVIISTPEYNRSIPEHSKTQSTGPPARMGTIPGVGNRYW
jgi:hypothetical protein